MHQSLATAHCHQGRRAKACWLLYWHLQISLWLFLSSYTETGLKYIKLGTVQVTILQKLKLSGWNSSSTYQCDRLETSLTFVQDVDRDRRPLQYHWLAFLRSGIATSVSPSTSTAPLLVARMLRLLKNSKTHEHLHFWELMALLDNIHVNWQVFTMLYCILWTWRDAALVPTSPWGFPCRPQTCLWRKNMWMNYLEKHAKTFLLSLEARRRGYH